MSQRDYLAAAMNGDVDQIEYLLEDKIETCENPKATTALTASFESNESGDTGRINFIDENGIQVIASMDIVSLFGTDSLIYELDESTEPTIARLSLVGHSVISDRSYILQVFVEMPEYKAGSVELHGIVNNTMLFEVFHEDAEPIEAGIKLISTGHSGTISLSSAGDGTNSKIQGKINVQMGYVNAAQ